MNKNIKIVNRKQALEIAIKNSIKYNHKLQNKIKKRNCFNAGDINKAVQPGNNLLIIELSKASEFEIILHDIYGMHIIPVFKKKNKDMAKIWKKMLNHL